MFRGGVLVHDGELGAFMDAMGDKVFGVVALLALSLLAHCAPLSALLKVLLSSEQLHMLAPTRWSDVPKRAWNFCRALRSSSSSVCSGLPSSVPAAK